MDIYELNTKYVHLRYRYIRCTFEALILSMFIGHNSFIWHLCTIALGMGVQQLKGRQHFLVLRAGPEGAL